MPFVSDLLDRQLAAQVPRNNGRRIELDAAFRMEFFLIDSAPRSIIAASANVTMTD